MEDDESLPEKENETPGNDDGLGTSQIEPADSPSHFGDHFLELERARDPKGNEDTRPPDDEVVSFRSMTVVEMYAGQAIDGLKIALTTIEWVNFDTAIVDVIAEAQKGYTYSRGVF